MKQDILNRDKNEVVIHEIKQHPFGMIAIWITAIFVSITVLIGLGILSANKDDLGLAEITGLLAVVGALFCALVIGHAAVMTWVYQQNELVITNENIIEITQNGIFNKDVSQLNLAKIQDVSASHKGIISTALKYGTITIETAGEKESYRFSYCPKASECAKEIIEAHQNYMAAGSAQGHKKSDL